MNIGASISKAGRQAAGSSRTLRTLCRRATDDGGAVCIWWLKQEDLISQVQARLFRNLTRLEWELYFGNTPYRKTCPDLPTGPAEQSESSRTVGEPN